MNKVVYTSSLPKDVNDWLEEYAEKENVSKNSVIEKAIEAFKVDVIKEGLRADFKRMKPDLDWEKVGVEDMLHNLDK